RHQKLVEEAPAPFLSEEQNADLYRASKAILKEAGYVGAGTVEFLVGTDGTVSFLEVNTRLQVEHPVTEEVSGIDLVREMFRIADGEELGYDDPPLRGHSFEFRINGEDPGRNFLPAPGTVSVFAPPSGPGVRLDAGVESGSVIGPAWDSLLAKLIVTGATRAQALQRAARALAEFQVEGMATAIPFHRAVVADPAFTSDPFTVHTRWIETEFTNTIPPYTAAPAATDEDEETGARETVVVEVGGKRLEVSLPASLGMATAPAAASKKPKRKAVKKGGSAASGDALASPMQGTIVKVAVSEGDTVAEGDLIVVLEAMKMEQPLNAHRAGIIKNLNADVGASVSSGAVICEVKD
ncbi:biotin/lipoyl-containing protein, partial [Streptomyces sp. NPDC007983]|uniref:ATP-binding protein n=1 Tax=Streptomyces sp. NPDC007983 TaxID=3364800 RepID=UPI0036E06344